MTTTTTPMTPRALRVNLPRDEVRGLAELGLQFVALVARPAAPIVSVNRNWRRRRVA